MSAAISVVVAAQQAMGAAAAATTCRGPIQFIPKVTNTTLPCNYCKVMVVLNYAEEPHCPHCGAPKPLVNENLEKLKIESEIAKIKISNGKIPRTNQEKS